MIKGMQGLFYTTKAYELHAFIRDKLGFPCTDTGDGRFIFDLPGADLGAHPWEKACRTISFCCDHIGKTATELKSRGA